MQGVTMTSRATAFACAAGAVVFILSLLLGPGQDRQIADIGRSLIIAILCGTLSWASARRTVATIAAALDRTTDRLLDAAPRSEEQRVGKGGVGTGRARWS